MYGAIIGDLAGSIYEYDEFVENKAGIISFDRRIEAFNKDIISEKCFYSDDTILTISILDSIINNIPYDINLRRYCLENINNIPKNISYFKYMFSPNFINWCKNNTSGNSIGNGAMMRISPVAYLFNNENEIIKQSNLATSTSHNSPLAINSAKLVALIIFYLRSKVTKENLYKIIEQEYSIKLNFSLEKLQKENMFDSTCNILNKLLYILKISKDFNDAIKLTLSIGGDTDTNACIVGSIAEAMYGIPKEYINYINQKLPSNYIDLLNKGYSKIKL